MTKKKNTSKAIIKYNYYYLLQLRDNNTNIPVPNKWAFFGGGVLINEDPREALIREIKEELNFTVMDFNKTYKYYFKELNETVHYYSVELKKKKSFDNISEGQKSEWFSKDKMKYIPLCPDVIEYFKYENSIENEA